METLVLCMQTCQGLRLFLKLASGIVHSAQGALATQSGWMEGGRFSHGTSSLGSCWVAGQMTEMQPAKGYQSWFWWWGEARKHPVELRCRKQGKAGNEKTFQIISSRMGTVQLACIMFLATCQAVAVSSSPWCENTVRPAYSKLTHLWSFLEDFCWPSGGLIQMPLNCCHTWRAF